MNFVEKYPKIVGALFIGVYVIFRMALDAFWQPYFYTSYIFEMLFVSLAYYVYRKNFTLNRNFNKYDSLILLAGTAAGLLTAKSSGLMHLLIPFDLSSTLTIVFLLLISPILEEFIFRMALWDSFKSLWDNSWFATGMTAFLYALSTFIPFWFVPAEFRPFIYYQTSYTFVLALALGQQRERTKSLAAPILLHFMFNLGFYAGCWL